MDKDSSGDSWEIKVDRYRSDIRIIDEKIKVLEEEKSKMIRLMSISDPWHETFGGGLTES
jgi:hypothetical protein